MRSRLFLILFLLTLLAQSALGGNVVKVQFHCKPADATVYIRNERAELEHLGRADQPLTFTAEKFSEFTFKAEGYKDRVEPISIKAFNASEGDVAVYPRSGKLELEPTLLTRLKGWLPYLVLLTALAVGLLAFLKRKQDQLKEQQERVAFLESLQDSASGTKNSALGQKLGKYLLTAYLGQGGMAVVYRAVAGKDHRTGEQVAVKVLTAVDDEQTIERFRREVQICQKLIHPNIVALHDWGEDGELIYLALELIEGGSLEDRLKDGLDYTEALRIFDEILAGMEFAHEQGVTHRDLKPDNVMLTQGGRVKITDFGLAKLQTIRTVTVSGAVMGTPAYMAPEQIQGETPSPSMDQYGLGVLGYELFTGQLPFQAEDMMTVITKHLMETPADPKSVRSELPPELCALLMKMLEKEPEDRFRDLGEIRRALKDVPRDLETLPQ